jgi:uncharacterized protein YyaL (SSP411 family)
VPKMRIPIPTKEQSRNEVIKSIWYDTGLIFVEGAFATWTHEELAKLIGDDLELFSYHFGVQKDGN